MAFLHLCKILSLPTPSSSCMLAQLHMRKRRPVVDALYALLRVIQKDTGSLLFSDFLIGLVS